jgi:hypothetical protein
MQFCDSQIDKNKDYVDSSKIMSSTAHIMLTNLILSLLKSISIKSTKVAATHKILKIHNQNYGS